MSAWRTRCGVLASACVCLLLAARPAAAFHRTVVGDFDGDGRQDRATLKWHGDASHIRIWLSATHTTTVIHLHQRSSPSPVQWSGGRIPNRVEDPPDEASDADSNAGTSSVALLLSPRPRAPDLSPEPLTSRVSAGFRSAQLLAPVAPRPPPIN